jgi:fatty-acyl-CoA synthase
MYDAIAATRHHLCGAPIVMATLLNAPDNEKQPLPHVVEFFTAAAPPPEAVLAAMKEAGFNVTHVYGLTETYGPATTNEWHDAWDALPSAEQAAKKARQGVRYVPLEALDVRDPDTLAPVPHDGESMGEVMFRGNIVMKGYLKNKPSTQAAFAGGWFHSGDLGVMHPDGYIQLKDRSKDIIISGGENIPRSRSRTRSTSIRRCRRRRGRQARRQMGRDTVRVRRAQARHQATTDELGGVVPQAPRELQVPRYVVFTELPKTSTGKVQKFKLRELAKGCEGRRHSANKTNLGRIGGVNTIWKRLLPALCWRDVFGEGTLADDFPSRPVRLIVPTPRVAAPMRWRGSWPSGSAKPSASQS